MEEIFGLHIPDSVLAAGVAGFFSVLAVYVAWRVKSAENKSGIINAGLEAQLDGWTDILAGARSRIADLEKEVRSLWARMALIEGGLRNCETREQALLRRLGKYEDVSPLISIQKPVTEMDDD